MQAMFLCAQALILVKSGWIRDIKVLMESGEHFFFKVWGNVPTQNNLLLKYSKFKMIGIIMYTYIATIFFLSLDGSGSSQRHLRIRI